MYKRTIWQDHVEGIQEGTDLNAANFNNLEVGTMEAAALAALNASYRRYHDDMAQNSRAYTMQDGWTGSGTTHYVAILSPAVRNHTEYSVSTEILQANGGNAGDIIISTKQANGFSVTYNGTATSVVVKFTVTGGMFF